MVLDYTSFDVTTYTVNNLYQGIYYFRVSATKAFTVFSPYSNVIMVEVLLLPPPIAPSNLTINVLVSTVPGQIEVNWTDNSSDETGFIVSRMKDSIWSSLVYDTVPANTTSYVDNGLAGGVYHYFVDAYNINGKTNSYNYVKGTIVSSAMPAAPTNLSSFVDAFATVELNWVDNSNNEDKFNIERSPNGVTAWTVIGFRVPNFTSYYDYGLAAGIYYYRVNAMNTTGNSAYSNVVSANTGAPVPFAPSLLSACGISSGKINLSWQDNATNEDKFVIERSLNGTSAWAAIDSVAANVLTYSNTGLVDGTTYFYRVYAKNASGKSGYSDTDSIATGPQVWFPVSTGFGSGPSTSIDVMVDYNGVLLAAGRYSPMRKWNQSTWSNFNGPSATAMFVDNMEIYAGGIFTGGPVNKTISHFDGTTWSVVGGSNPNAYDIVNWNTNYRYHDIFKYNNELYARCDGAPLMKFNPGTQKFVVVGDPMVDVGVHAGGFAGIMNNKAYFLSGLGSIMVWDNVKWDTLNINGFSSFYGGSGNVFNGELYISGWFEKNGNIYGMVKYNGTNFTEVITTMNFNISKLFVTGNKMFCTGYNTINVWNGNSFTAIGVQNVNSNCLAVSQNILYAGGNYETFACIDGVNNIVQTAVTNPSLAAPTNLVISRSNKIALDWDDNSSNELGFVVKRSLDGVLWAIIDTTVANNFEDLTIAPLTTYHYLVYAYNADGNSNSSNAVSITTSNSIEKNNKQKTSVDIFPNPFNTFARLKINSESEINQAEFILFDILGKVVKKVKINAAEVMIDRNEINNGLYFYQLIYMGETLDTGKLIIN